MKRLILIILFLATTFESDNPPGWFQQTLPVNDVINDIFFLDSLTGWVVTDGRTNTNDTGYIMKTTTGGNNWTVQYNQPMRLSIVQFFDLNTGYVGGGSGTGTGRVFKTTNGGNSWNQVTGSTGIGDLDDMFFINVDTGWVCDKETFGGLIKTTNVCATWQLQLNDTFSPSKLFYINKDTGWVGTSDAKPRLFRTTNGGLNWNQIFLFNGSLILSMYFSNGLNGWVGGAGSGNIKYTTDGGFSWNLSSGEIGGYDIKFVNDSIGYSGTFSSFKILKSINGGKNWGYQNTPILSGSLVATLRNDTSNAWAGQIMHTTDGGGPITYIGISPIGSVVPSFALKQNYPNPFNPSTNITFEVTKNSKISLKIFNMLGEEIEEIIDYEKHNTGTYTVNYNADELASGVYFYQMTAWTEDKKEIFIDTKKMILLK